MDFAREKPQELTHITKDKLGIMETEKPPQRDPNSPFNWSRGRKLAISTVLSFMTFIATMGASIISPAIFSLEAYFEVKRVVAILSLSLYLLGIALGTLTFAPLSEVYGRNRIYHPTWFLFVVLQIPTALTSNVAAHFFCRFLTGLMASPALTVSGGTLTDIWELKEIGIPLGFVLLSAFLGPVAGPIIGGYLTEYAPSGATHLESWRWILWFMLIVSATLGLNFLWLPETYLPEILAKKAEEVNFRDIPMEPGMYSSTEDIAYDQKRPEGLAEWAKLRRSMARPILLLVQDPIVLLMSLYLSLIYGVLFLYFGAYPVIFTLARGWKPGPSGLAFLGIGLGTVLSLPTAALGNKNYLKKRAEREVKGIMGAYPEGRLPMAIVASVLAPASAFWFAWTGPEKVHWLAPVASGVPFGWSMVTMFVCVLSYLGEAYVDVSASCMASATLLRCLFAFGFPLFMPQMYTNLGAEWAGTLIGCLLLVFAPIPLLFYKYGEKLRSRSKFSAKIVTSSVSSSFVSSSSGSIA